MIKANQETILSQEAPSRLNMLLKAEHLLFLVFLVAFFINFKDIQPFIAIKKTILLSFCLVVCLSTYLQSHSRSLLVILVVTVTLTALNYFFTSENYIVTDSLIFLTILAIPNQSLILKNNSSMRKIEYLTAIAIFGNLLFFRTSGRSSIGNIDPNYSSLLIFLFVCYLIKMKRQRWFIAICALAGLLTLSRTYFLAIILLPLALLIPYKKIKLVFFLGTPLIFLFSLHYFTSGSLKERFPLLYDISENLYYKSGEHTNPLRILHLIGNTSDNIRARINNQTLELMKKDSQFLMFGGNPESFDSIHGFKMAHNFYLFQISQSGILLGLIALLIVYYIFLTNFNSTNSAILVGFTSYMAFLGIEVGSIYFIFLVLILCLNAPQDGAQTQNT